MMDLSEHTVTHYLTNAANKLNAANRVHAVAIAMRLKLLD
jgi:DNA-binding CsgD family transcriptional regulator